MTLNHRLPRRARPGNRLGEIESRRRRGFSLLEVMIALVVLLVALMGALGGLIAAASELHDGQVRQAKMVLVEAKTQRLMLQDHKSLPFTGGGVSPNFWPPPIACPNPVPETVAVGNFPWFVDPTPAVLLPQPDLGTGAYFNITPNGQITHNTTIPAGTPCNSVPAGVYCREVFISNTVELTTYMQGSVPQQMPVLANPFSVFVRISRGGDNNLAHATVQRDLVVQ